MTVFEPPKKILIVDDDPLNIEVLVAMLNDFDVKILKAQGGAEALGIVEKEKPDLILLDVMMPGVSGFDVAKQLKADRAHRHIPTIMVTALSDTENKIKGLEAGADDFLTKPVDQTELKARVKSLLKVKGYHDQLQNYNQILEAEVARRTQDLQIALTRRENLEAQLLRSQKLEAIGTLAGGIAHDFNNILSSIIGFAELAMDEAEKGTELWDDLDQIIQAGERAADMINQILTFSREKPGELRPIQLHLIVKEVAKLLEATLTPNIKLKTRIRSDAYAMADATQILQVLMNLCTNAAHAMSKTGGELEVRITNVADDDRGLRKTLKPVTKTYMEMTIRDTGCGIDPAISSRIFDPYFTTKDLGKGTGIGLSIVHSIIENHNGALTFTSKPGQGTTFKIYLPVVEKKTDHPHAPPREYLRGSEHIFLVDDEQVITVMESRILTNLGYRVTCETNSAKALEKFKQNPKLYDLLIVDYMMPEMTGVELAAEVNKIRNDIPIMLCTGYDMKVMSDQIEPAGIKSVIVKPMRKDKISKAVRDVLNQSKSGTQNDANYITH